MAEPGLRVPGPARAGPKVGPCVLDRVPMGSQSSLRQMMPRCSFPWPARAPGRAPARALGESREEPRAVARVAVRRRHRRARAAGRGLAAAGVSAAARGPPRGTADGVHVRLAGRRALLLRRAPAPRQLARLPRAGPGPPGALVGGGGHGGGGGRVRGLADRGAHRTDHLPARPLDLPGGGVLDRAPRLAAHPGLAGRVRRPAPGPGVRHLQLLPARLRDRAAVHDAGCRWSWRRRCGWAESRPRWS